MSHIFKDSFGKWPKKSAMKIPAKKNSYIESEKKLGAIER